MAIVCPYSTTAKTVRAGRFAPKCPKCGRAFELVVTLSGDKPVFQCATLPGDTSKSGSFDPNRTAPTEVEAPKSPARDSVAATAVPHGGAGSDADFSVAASALRSAPGDNPDQTAALNETTPPAPRVNLESTEADLSAAMAKADCGDAEMPRALGGYQIVKELGRGGMGAVYLARQVSLDRPVALKVMNPRWASNPDFLVRFTREAYAAAQLVHHNIVQVYDIDEDKGLSFFSMEYVEGTSLGDLVKKEKRLPPDVAAGYALQAARGLQFAHERGMIHRDIKPDNLMLNAQGVVKVADLGLVRTPGMEEVKPAEEPKGVKGRSLGSLSNVTMVGQAMGTPAYMAPEQARDATKVDARADVYSLGCTLYVMVTGQPLFKGGSALEVMTKHAYDPVVPPDKVVKEVPKALADVVVKMVAKKPEDRYPSMGEVIQALEDYMGVAGTDPASQTEAHVKTLEQGLKGFLDAPAARLRAWVLLGFFAGCAALVLLLVLLGFKYSWTIAGGVFALGFLTAASYLVVHGATRRTHLFLKCRDLLFSLGWLELGKIVLGALLFVGALWLFGQLWVWVLAGIVGVGLSLALHYTLDRQVTAQRAASLEKVETMLRTLRVRGLSEDALHEFVSKYSGEQWEEFFEALFGYEAKLAARAKYGHGPKGARPRYAAWRDPIVTWIDRFQRRKQEERERKHLQAIEQKSLVAKGVDKEQAKAQAEAVAQAMVQKAAEIKQDVGSTSIDPTVVASSPAKKAPPRRINVQEMFEVAVTPPPKKTVRPGLAIEHLLNGLFGGSVRFLVGASLLLGFLAWLALNRSMPVSVEGASNPEAYRAIWANIQSGGMKPLGLPFFGEYLSSLNAGAAGLVLILSSIWRHWKIGFLVLLGAAVMVVGPSSGYVPSVGPLTPQLASLAIGGGIAALGFVLGRGT
jgi:hypothetical protein